jgi:lipoyl(octanoyl) transferase
MALDFLHLGLGTELCDYEQTWQLQRSVHAEVATGTRPDTVLVLEHAEVYTAGKRTEPHERPISSSVPVVEVDRGGKITWHGPGQLVVYPIIRLPEAVGVVDYVRRLEEAMIALFAEYGLVTGRVRGRSGVWLAAEGDRPERKIAAIGVRVASGTTMHGLAINVDPDMGGFARIVPCGLSDVGVTSLAAELGESPSLAEVTHLLRPHLEHYLAFQPYEQSTDIGLPVLATAAAPTYGLTVGAA